MAGDGSDATLYRPLPLDQKKGKARRRGYDRRRREGGRDRGDRARDAANAWIDRARRAPGPEERKDRGDHRERDRCAEALIRGSMIQRESELEHGQRGPVREFDRRDAADEERERGLPRQRSLGLRA